MPAAAKVETRARLPSRHFDLPFTAEGPVITCGSGAKRKTTPGGTTPSSASFSGAVSASAAPIPIGHQRRRGNPRRGIGRRFERLGWQDNGLRLRRPRETILFHGTSRRFACRRARTASPIDQIRAVAGRLRDVPRLASRRTTRRFSPSRDDSAAAELGSPWTARRERHREWRGFEKDRRCSGCPDAGASGHSRCQRVGRVLGGSGVSRGVRSGARYEYQQGFATITHSVPVNGTWRCGSRSSTGRRAFRLERRVHVAIEGGTVRYRRNGSLVYTSKTPRVAARHRRSASSPSGATVQIVGSTARRQLRRPPRLRRSPHRRERRCACSSGTSITEGMGPTACTTRTAWRRGCEKNPTSSCSTRSRNIRAGAIRTSPVYKNLLQLKTRKTCISLRPGYATGRRTVRATLSCPPIRSATPIVRALHNYDRSIALATITVNARPIP